MSMFSGSTQDAAAYISLISLVQDLELLLSSYQRLFGSDHESKNIPFRQEEIQILYQNINLTESLLREYSDKGYDLVMMSQFKIRIGDVAQRAAKYIDDKLRKYFHEEPQVVHLPGQVTGFYMDPESSMRLQYRTAAVPTDNTLQKVSEDIHSINEELKKIVHETMCNSENMIPTSTSNILEINVGGNSIKPSSSQKPPTEEGFLVGLDEELVEMLDCLTGQPSSELKVIPVIGMAGIGKTTFARKIYEDPLIVHHFYIRAWVTISLEYRLKESFIRLLHAVSIQPDDAYKRWNEDLLKEKVYKKLKGRRYIIILDDMWDSKAWDGLRMVLPDDKNGSRIIVTSRNKDMALYVSPNSRSHSLRCLTLEESWELLFLKVFANESCPDDMIQIGMEIAYKSKGLPLALVLIGGILSKMNKKFEVWEEVAQNIGTLIMEESEHCRKILALSYKHLPDRLKPCFLYLGIFPEDYEIPVQKLLQLWIAEGFIRSCNSKTMEEVAEEYFLEDLVSRNLIMVNKRRSNGRIKTCCIHDLTRDMCVRIQRTGLHADNQSE